LAETVQTEVALAVLLEELEEVQQELLGELITGVTLRGLLEALAVLEFQVFLEQELIKMETINRDSTELTTEVVEAEVKEPVPLLVIE
jgi:hypothetical protein